MFILGVCIGLIVAHYIKKPYRQLALELLNNDKEYEKNQIKVEAVKLGKSPRIMWNVYRQEEKKYNRRMKKLNK